MEVHVEGNRGAQKGSDAWGAENAEGKRVILDGGQGAAGLIEIAQGKEHEES